MEYTVTTTALCFSYVVVLVRVWPDVIKITVCQLLFFSSIPLMDRGHVSKQLINSFIYLNLVNAGLWQNESVCQNSPSLTHMHAHICAGRIF